MTLEYGKSFPEKRRRPGPYAVYGSNGEIGRAHEYLLEEPTIIVGRKGSAGEINWAEAKSWPIDTTYYVNVIDGRVHSLDFIYYLLNWIDPRRFIDTTTKPGLNRDRIYEQTVPVPPLPVQERIVQILLKADEIRRKRQEALELADAILPALFLEIIGDPTVNPKRWNAVKLEDVCSEIYRYPTYYGITYKEIGIPEVRGEMIMPDGTINVSDVRYIEKGTADRFPRTKLQTGDIVMSVRGTIGKLAMVPPELDGANMTANLLRISPNREKVLPDYLYSFLSSTACRFQVEAITMNTTIQTIKASELKAMPVVVPPIPIQKTFVHQSSVLRSSASKALEAYRTAEATYAGLLSRAFSGQLTAEWEAANADWITTQIDLYERLPRLLLLALIRERAARAEKATQAAVLVTALMKYSFLLQMEGNCRRFYHFVPYHYGPFAKELYADLERLQADGLVTVDNDTGEDKTRITLADRTRADTVLDDLPDVLKKDVASIIDAYGDLGHKALLKIVYEKYPAYAKKTRITKGHKTSSAGTRQNGRP
jgi:type I restriction enzyme S subunit